MRVTAKPRPAEVAGDVVEDRRHRVRLQRLAGQPRGLARIADEHAVAAVGAAPGEADEHVDVEDRLARAGRVAGVELLDPGRAVEAELAPRGGRDRQRRADRDERALGVEVAAVDLAQQLVLAGLRRRGEDALLERQQRVVDADEEEVVADQDVAALQVQRRLVEARGRAAAPTWSATSASP